jgi:hypothetical protein
MARHGKLSRDQKRKQKLAKRAKSQAECIQPYVGTKYKSERFVEPLMRAEMGIYESYVMTDRQLTDAEVVASLEYLIRRLRGEQVEPPAQNPQTDGEDGQPEDLTAWRIQAHWDEFFADHPRPSNADLAGVLRTILNSVDVWSHRGPSARGYLHYLEGFMGKLGFEVEVLRGDEEVDLEGEPGDDVESREQVLTQLGEAWISSRDAAAKREFDAEAKALLDEGRPGLVLEVCERLIGMTNEPIVHQELQHLLEAAWKQQSPSRSEGTMQKWLQRAAPRWFLPGR